MWLFCVRGGRAAWTDDLPQASASVDYDHEGHVVGVRLVEASGPPREAYRPPEAPVEDITRLLAGMGGTPDEVAQTLRAAGVKGLRDSTGFLNPIVRHLNRSLSIGGRLEVGAAGTVLRLQLDGKVREVSLPLPVQVFLDGFHRGLYPDLEG